MRRTFCAVIRDRRAEDVLGPFADRMARARHWAFREIHVRDRRVGEVKVEAQRRFGLTARRFNGVRFDLDQAVAAWKGGLDWRRSQTLDRIEATEEHLARIEAQAADEALSLRRRRSAEFRAKGKRRHLGRLRDRLGVIERDLKGRPKICFGGRDLLRRGEIGEWRARRASAIALVGSKGETCGNQSAQWDGRRLRLRLPEGFDESHLEFDVSFRYGQEEMLEALARGVAIAWRIFRREDGLWAAHATIGAEPADLVTDVRAGCLGVDLNVDHLAVALVDHDGNLVGRERIPFPVAGTDENRARAMIGEAVARLCALATARHFGIAVESLDFQKKKAALKVYGAAHARRLSGFAYAAFFEALASRAAREGVDLVRVNAAFTSVIGGLKYASGLRATRHLAAALVIARRAQGFGERFVCMDGVSLRGPARSRATASIPVGSRRRWSRWRGARRWLSRKESETSCPDSAITAGSVSGSRRSGRVSTQSGGGAAPPSGLSRSGPRQAGNAVAPARHPAT